MLRVVFFGGRGEFSAAHLEALARAHNVVTVFAAGERASPVGRWLRAAGLRTDAVHSAAKAMGVPCWLGRLDEASLRHQVAQAAPDVLCIAGYPRRLPRTVYDLAPLGAFNVHPSLLPRHRGLRPFFWVYYRNDAEAGVTVHHVTERFDAGDIVGQARFPLARGLPVATLSRRTAAAGSHCLVDTLAALARGQLTARAQDGALATLAPAVRPGTPMLDPSWDVERAWHFLAGLVPWFREPLLDEHGRKVTYNAVLGYERLPHVERPRMVHWHGSEALLFCPGGVVRLQLDQPRDGFGLWRRRRR